MRARLPALLSFQTAGCRWLAMVPALPWWSDGPDYERSPHCGRRDCKNHRDECPRPPVVVGGLCHRCDLDIVACVSSSNVCQSDPPRVRHARRGGLVLIGLHPRNRGLRRARKPSRCARGEECEAYLAMSESGHEPPSPACSQLVSSPLHSRCEGRERRELPVGVPCARPPRRSGAGDRTSRWSQVEGSVSGHPTERSYVSAVSSE
jgi:hypothetical protein